MNYPARIPVYQADAFTSEIFGGNPAAICPLDEWMPDGLMQRIAMENNLAETAFVVKEGQDYRIRWFTPTVEVDLCGHATLAAAHVYFSLLGQEGDTIRFQSKSGWLVVRKNPDGQLTLDFPIDIPEPVSHPPAELFSALAIAPVPAWKGRFDYLISLENEAAVAALKPDFNQLMAVKSRGLIVTAPGLSCDFVSRCFFPQSGINEDPVTGSAHCLLAAYWQQMTGKNEFDAIQISGRRGHLHCKVSGNRVLLSGQAVLFMKGEILLDHGQ